MSISAQAYELDHISIKQYEDQIICFYHWKDQAANRLPMVDTLPEQEIFMRRGRPILIVSDDSEEEEEEELPAQTQLFEEPVEASLQSQLTVENQNLKEQLAKFQQLYQNRFALTTYDDCVPSFFF